MYRASAKFSNTFSYSPAAMKIKRLFLALVTLLYVMFDEAITWATSKEATDQILDRLKAAGFNTYIPCVWHGGGTFYPSPLNRADPRLVKSVGSGEDRLEYLVKRAHAMGIEVHPWFTVALRSGNEFPEFAEAGVPEGKYNIHDAKFRAFIHGVMIDVVKRYPVDGVNIDYIRTGGFCLAESCIEDYRKKFDRSLRMDLLLRKIPGVHIDSLAKWNQQAVNEIVSKFTLDAKRLRPDLVISVDAKPLDPNSEAQGQDSIGWTNNGWVDVVYNMDYGRALNLERGLKARAALHDPGKLTTLAALYDLEGKIPISRPAQQLIDYIEISRRQFPGTGIAFYHLPRLSDEQLQALQKGPFKDATRAWMGLNTDPKGQQ
jgi:uncharacterized lipoprotein YddW (UPF0748 family)